MKKVVTPSTELTGRDRHLLKLIFLLKPEAASVRVSLTGHRGEITAELERVLKKLVDDQSKGILVNPDEIDSPLLAAQYTLGLQ